MPLMPITMADFQPDFVIANTLGIAPTVINWIYCAMPEAATRLQEHMNTLGFHPTVVYMPPLPGWATTNGGVFFIQGPPTATSGSEASQGLVPWLSFAGTDANGNAFTTALNVGPQMQMYMSLPFTLQLDWALQQPYPAGLGGSQ